MKKNDLYDASLHLLVYQNDEFVASLTGLVPARLP